MAVLRYSGDVVKALAAGGSSVMIGSLVAGNEKSHRVIQLSSTDVNSRSYRGMGSLEAMENGSKDRYFQSGTADVKKLVPEGIAARVPYKGTLYEVIYQLVGGLACRYGILWRCQYRAVARCQIYPHHECRCPGKSSA